MFPIRQEASNFVRACEGIHALLARGDTLDPEEKDLIEYSGLELLTRIRPV